MEATGGFETLPTSALAMAGFAVVVVNPAQVRAFADALGKRAKIYAIDATEIVRFVDVNIGKSNEYVIVQC